MGKRDFSFLAAAAIVIRRRRRVANSIMNITAYNPCSCNRLNFAVCTVDTMIACHGVHAASACKDHTADPYSRLAFYVSRLLLWQQKHVQDVKHVSVTY